MNENQKPTFTLLSGKKAFNPESLSKLFEKLTGKPFSEEGLAYARQKFEERSEAQKKTVQTDELLKQGGPGSGNFGHSGRPGEIGGSGEGGVDSSKQTPLLNRGDSLREYAKAKDDPSITTEKIMSKFTPAEAKEFDERVIEANKPPATHDEYSDGKGNYTAERKDIHDKIINEILSQAQINAATPKYGERPTFVVLGGRAGSGKTAFSNGTINEFDSDKFLVLDTDKIKAGLIPPYQGWNAAEVHEESSYIFKQITERAKMLGLNVVHDATLKSMNAQKYIDSFKSSGYRIEGHYMHLPRQMSGERAVKRYLGHDGKRGRLVPVNYIMHNTENEANFDRMKSSFDRWTAWDNSGKKGTPPVLLQRSDS